MQPFVLVIHVLVSICLIALVLLQQGRGAAVGASFGSGASQTLFGSRGSTSFLFKLTAGFATIFFITSLTLAYLASHRSAEQSDILLSVPENSALDPLAMPKEPTSTTNAMPMAPTESSAPIQENKATQTQEAPVAGEAVQPQPATKTDKHKHKDVSKHK